MEISFMLAELEKTLKIKSHDKLLSYLEYCVSRKNNKKITRQTAHHHILPKEYFPEYKVLKLHTWNGVHLTHQEHTEAHRLLHESVVSSKMAYAYVTCARVSKEYENNPYWIDVKTEAWKVWSNEIAENGRRNIENIAAKGHATKAQTGYHKEWGLMMSAFLTEEIKLIDGTTTNRAKLQNKIGLETKQNTITDNGKSIHQNAIDSIRRWQLAEIVLNDGTITTNQKEVVKKSVETRKTKLLENGLTSEQNSARKNSERLKKEIIKDGKKITVGKANMIHATAILTQKLDTEIVEYKGEAMTLREKRRRKMIDTKAERRAQKLLADSRDSCALSKVSV